MVKVGTEWCGHIFTVLMNLILKEYACKWYKRSLCFQRCDWWDIVITQDKHNFWAYKFWIFPYPSVLTYVLGTQKNPVIETVLLSTHNTCFGWEIRNNFHLHTLYLWAWLTTWYFTEVWHVTTIYLIHKKWPIIWALKILKVGGVDKP